MASKVNIVVLFAFQKEYFSISSSYKLSLQHLQFAGHILNYVVGQLETKASLIYSKSRLLEHMRTNFVFQQNWIVLPLRRHSGKVGYFEKRSLV